MNYLRSIRFLSIWAVFPLFSSTGWSQQADANATPTINKNGTEPEPAVTAVGKLSLNKLQVALKANKNPEAMLAERDALQKYLTAKMGVEVEVIIPTSSAAILEGFANQTIDVGYLSSTDAARNLAQDAASVLLVHLRNGQPHYDSIWLSLADKKYESIEELKGKPVAFAKRSSTSGFLIPLRDLHERKLINETVGLEDFFSKTIYGTGYVSAVEKVLSGEAEAAAVSDYVYTGDKYLDADQKSKLKILQKQGPVPSHTICYRLSLSNEDRDFIRATLLAMNADNPELRDKVFNGELVEVNPEEHLKVTLEALAIEAQYEEYKNKAQSWTPS
ncbi:MAG: phosphate/phosphite/phosphonate ABC transporter substrate-binding protein, partial [Opitutales bacterium]